MISIIVPCYNVEKYIDRCVDSLVTQTVGLDEMEIILVNDASTDDTLSHLQKWEKLYPNNIMVITYETNLRQGGARNVGLSYARGEFIGFVDSDDWVEPQMYEFLLKGIEESGCDISRCKYIRDPGKEGSGYKLKKGSFKNDTVDFEIIKCFENSGFYYMPPLQTSEDNE